MNISINSGETGTTTVTLNNTSGQPINFDATATGGTQTFDNYVWQDSDMAGGPAFEWVDISSTGTLMTGISSSDDASQAVSLSFTFPYYGQNFTTAYVSSNGYVTFGAGATDYTNTGFPSTNDPPNIVAALYDDLRPNTNGDIYYLDDGERLIVQFNNVRELSAGANVTFQIVLEATGVIKFYYKTVSTAVNSFSSGVQNATRDKGVTILHNQAGLKDNLAVRIANPSPWMVVSPSSGIVAAGNTADLTVSLDAVGLWRGTASGSIDITHDLVGQGPLSIPVTATINPVPQVALTDLPPNAGFINGGNILLKAEASDDTSVSKVEFYEGSTKLGEVTSAPYDLAWNSVPSGTYAITAKAHDGDNATRTTLPVTITVQVDSDSDGLGDAWETAKFGNLTQIASGNTDSDGATHLQEYQGGSDPIVADTDGDSMTDGEEYTNGLSPSVADAFDDDDGDRYPNIFEVKNATNPLSAASVPTAHYVVNPAGGGTHTTIASAISAATLDYKIIRVVAGTYQGTSNTGISITSKKILLISASGAGKTILDAQNA
ncbi:MAG TPA: Ig-like domain-containing protein, partial [Roseimicrobium sp.]|nr:Ig-like domain-containing protein [Roseimicrobium sp.]